MQALPNPEWLTEEEYLEAERHSHVRHEYIGGKLYAMAGASDEHIAVSMNVAFALRNHLKGGPCRVQISEGKVKVQVGAESIFYYPDVIVTCDPRDTDRYFKRYPKVLIEVLSESTEAIDRREKYLNYRQLETLEEYVLVAQDQVEVTVFRRSQQWQGEILKKRSQELRFESLKFAMPLNLIYEGVKLPGNA